MNKVAQVVVSIIAIGLLGMGTCTAVFVTSMGLGIRSNAVVAVFALTGFIAWIYLSVLVVKGIRRSAAGK